MADKERQVDFWIRGDILSRGCLLADHYLPICGTDIAGSPSATRPDSDAIEDFEGSLILPGLVELHMHGARGFDVVDGCLESVDAIASYLLDQGVCGFVAAIVSTSQERTLQALSALSAYVRANQGPKLLGVLFEGPFISPDKGGAHKRECLRVPDLRLLEQYLAHMPTNVKALLTLAPELPGALELLAACNERGVIVGLGHSTADYLTATNALEHGARYGVHLFNAMPALHHREPGLVGALLDNPGAIVELICDFIHVHPSLIRLVLERVGHQRVALVTDTTGPAGLPPGPHSWDGREVIVSAKDIRLLDGTLAGSNLTTQTLFRNLRSIECAIEDIVTMRSRVPAELLGHKDDFGELAPQHPANITVMSDDFEVRATYVFGRRYDRSQR